MMERWNAARIVSWAENSFGPWDALSIAVRMNKEMAELLSAFSNNAPVESIVGELADLGVMIKQIRFKMGVDAPFARENDNDSGPYETALNMNSDFSLLMIHLMGGRLVDQVEYLIQFESNLIRLCNLYNVDLHRITDDKMDINEKRTWGKAADGSFQHE